MIRLKFSLFENTCITHGRRALLEFSYGLDTQVDTNNKSLIWEVVPQSTSEQAKSVLFKTTHLQEVAADRNVLEISFIFTSSPMRD